MHVTTPSWIKKALLGFIIVCALFTVQDASAQRVALKTNALEYLALTPNLTLEGRLSRKISLQLGASANPLKAISNYRTSNYRVEPEVRYWFNRPMAKHFMALSFSAGAYSLQFKERFFSGDAVAAGISYGYALVLGRHWNMEAEIGLGLATVRGYKYKGAENKPDDINYRKTMPVPIRCALSFGYIFK